MDTANVSMMAAAKLLTEWLANEGYRSVRTLDEPDPAAEGAECRVRLEARRSGVSYKGHGILLDGRVQGVSIRPSYELFP